MDIDGGLAEYGNVVSLAAARRLSTPPVPQSRPLGAHPPVAYAPVAHPSVVHPSLADSSLPAEAYDRRQAIERLRRALSPGGIVYTVRRWFHPDNDWLVCDFFHINAHDVTCITQDVALALECFDPGREVGVKLDRPGRTDPLAALIDGRLSTLLYGEPGVVQHAVIA
jgi:hypothetical protein